jgi:hypothetical protein
MGDAPPAALAHLRDEKRWVAWRYLLKKAKKGKWKWTKPPVNPHTGKAASVSDPATWGTFDDALAAMHKYGLAGVGLVLYEAGGVSGIDLDDCIIDSDCLTPLAAEVIEYAETYAECSPSGEGIRLFVSGDVAKTLKDDGTGIEVYDHGRYLTVTGRHFDGTPTEIRSAPRTLARLTAEVEANREAKRARGKPNGEGAPRPNGKSANGHVHAGGGDFFKNVNAAALARLDDWVPVLLPTARKHATGAWRVTSEDLGRDLEEDLSFHPEGIRDHGEECGLTPIDAVLRYSTAKGATEAVIWLCERLVSNR